MQEPQILANEAELRIIESLSHDPAFDTAGVLNLHGFLAVYWNLIERQCPEFSSFIPSLQHLNITVDSIREEENEPKLTSEWEYGHSLFTLLNRPARRSLRSFGRFEDIAYPTRNQNTLHPDDDPYTRVDLDLLTPFELGWGKNPLSAPLSVWKYPLSFTAFFYYLRGRSNSPLSEAGGPPGGAQRDLTELNTE